MDKEEIMKMPLQKVNQHLARIRRLITNDERLRKAYGGDYVWAAKVKGINDSIKKFKSQQRYLRIRRQQLLIPKLKQDVADQYNNRRQLLGPKRVWVKK